MPEYQDRILIGCRTIFRFPVRFLKESAIKVFPHYLLSWDIPAMKGPECIGHFHEERCRIGQCIITKHLCNKNLALERTSFLMTLQGLRPAAVAPQSR